MAWGSVTDESIYYTYIMPAGEEAEKFLKGFFPDAVGFFNTNTHFTPPDNREETVKYRREEMLRDRSNNWLEDGCRDAFSVFRLLVKMNDGTFIYFDPEEYEDLFIRRLTELPKDWVWMDESGAVFDPKGSAVSDPKGSAETNELL